MTDLCRLIVEHRKAFEHAAFSAIPLNRPIVLLLLSRNPFSIGRTSSPVTMPEWFPIRGGLITHVLVEDLFWTAKANLRAARGADGRKCAPSYSILMRRWSVASEAPPLKTPSECMAFFDQIRIPAKKDKNGKELSPIESFPDFLDGAEASLKEVKSPEGFRPGAKDAAFDDWSSNAPRVQIEPGRPDASC